MTQTRRTWWDLRGWPAAAAFIAAVFLAAGAGQWLAGEPGQWYRLLRKPFFTPPGWLFGPVWTVLYVCMGVAAWLVWRRDARRGRGVALAAFSVQLALNAAWPALFFGLRSPAIAFADIVALWLAVVWTTWTFFRASRPAGWLMVPYLGWLSFAVALNLAIWRLNA